MPGVRVHDIRLLIADTPDLIDFSHANRLFEVGYEQMCSYLRREPSHARHYTPTTPPPARAGFLPGKATTFGAVYQLAGKHS
jgi:hypothetical protein